MMKMMRITVKRAIKLIVVTQLIILATYFISFAFYINAQVAFLSSLLVIIGSSFAYRKMVNTQIESDNIEDKRDILDEIEDPHELYDDELLKSWI